MKFQISNLPPKADSPLADKFQNYGLLWLSIFVLFIFANNAFAAQSVLQLTPFLIHQDLQRGQTLTQEVIITNNSTGSKYLTLSLNDFLPAGTDGETEILPVNQWAPSQVSLARWITIDQQPKYNLLPGESTKIKFFVNVPLNAEAGAHYGALLFTLDDQLVLPGQTKIRQQSAVLIILDVGRGFESGNLSSFSLSAVGDQTNRLQFSTTFHNSGLSSLQPKGKIVVYDIFNRSLATTYINPDANIVLPATDRIFVSRSSGSFWGRYTAVAVATYGSNKLQSRATLVFWVWPPVTTMIWGIFYAIILISLLVFLIRRYNAWLRSKTKQM